MKDCYRLLSLWSLMLCCLACGKTDLRITEELGEAPAIFPDYKDVTVPVNIAPLNFSYTGKEECRLLVEGADGEWQLEGAGGLFSFPPSRWKRLMERNKGKSLKLTVAVRRAGGWAGHEPFRIHVAPEPIDPYLSYRLIPPGYEGWKKMGLYQRNLENYEQTALYENELTDGNCVNCHAYCGRDPGRMLFHARAGHAGTVLLRGRAVEKLPPVADPSVASLVYPCWHPSGRYVAFSTNQTRQSFFSGRPDRVEVYDLASDVVVYDLHTHRVAYSPLTKSDEAFETYPAFSPDGKSLYFCLARALGPLPRKYKEVKYSLCRIGFDPEGMTFGSRVDTLYDAPSQGKSVSFPRVSPDGRFLAFTLHGAGTFSIWHKDADLYLADLRTGQVRPLSEANSDDTESYHTWSGNSRWIVFSSRRIDGLYTRPFIAYVDGEGKAAKPFLLPQKDPAAYYARLMYSYNIPELTSGKVKIDRHAVSRLLRGEGKGNETY